MIKQFLIARKDLNMRKGKTAVQCAHASLGALMRHSELVRVPGFEGLSHADGYLIPTSPELEEWLREGCTKVCLGVGSEAELWDIYQRARKITDYCYLVIDAGRTEFKGVPTKTAVAIGPVEAEKVGSITDPLALL